MNAEELVAYARQREDVLTQAIRDFHPVYHRQASDYQITAKAAEVACQDIRDELTSNAQIDNRMEDPVVAFLRYDPDTLVAIANQTWFGMPESVEVRSHPGFFPICEVAEGYDDEDEAV